MDDYAAPLLNMLALVPDNEISTNGIAYYLDHQAITTAYPGTERIPSLSVLNDLNAGELTPSSPGFGQLVWWRIFTQTDSTFLQTIIRFDDEWRETVGFTYFDIDRQFYFGTPSSQSLIVQGDFDMDTVREAFIANGYTHATNFAGSIWCGEIGCEGGSQTNPEEREPGNPFGGDMGRQQPRALGDRTVMSSPLLEQVVTHVAAANGDSVSLADDSRYRAAVRAVAQEGPLIQAWFVDGQALLDLAGDASLSILGLVGYDPRDTDTTRLAAIETLLEDFTPLPLYDLVMFADTATGDQHVTYVALVYSNPADAQIAAEVVTSRIDRYISLSDHRPLSDILAERDLEDITTGFVEPVEGSPAVMLLRLGTQKANLAEVITVTEITMAPQDLGVAPPGEGFRLMTAMLQMRDLGWLSAVPREFLESRLDE